jgi:PAS domain S-box-containing protein
LGGGAPLARSPEHHMKTTIDTHALTAAIGDAVIVCDTTGKVVLWNPAAERMFGFTEAEAMGQSMDMIIPERLRKRHWEGYEKTMATGITRYGHDLLKVPAINKAGQAMSIAFTVALLHDATGKVSAIASVIRDETVRFGEERALKKRLTELEAAAASGSGAT